MPRPNILYIHSHDTGRYIQPYGHPVHTPNLQRLAEQGVVFRQNYSMAPTCSPSRAALVTGMAPHSAGMIGLAHRGFALHDYRQHLVHTLHGAGYTSALAGVQHVAPRDELIGYRRVLLAEGGGPRPRATADAVATAAVEYLRHAPDQPFFLSVGFFETHREFHPPGPEDDPRYLRPPDPLPDTSETRRDMAGFHASARALDEGMGRVFAALDETGLAEHTLVICTTDHGLAFPGMKCNLTQHGLGTLLILRGPGGFRGGQVCDALVSHVDIFPTLCDLLQITPPAWLHGRSLMPLVGGKAQVNDEVYGEVTYHAAYEPQRAVRTCRYNYVRRYGQHTGPVLPNCDDSPSKTLWMEAGWAQSDIVQEQLYDLLFDPQERSNLAGDPQMAPALAEMRQRLESWMARTNDPLLAGEPVPAPRGAQVNDPEGLSPRETPRVVT
jgi:arylsulfatase A-like enzyme